MKNIFWISMFVALSAFNYIRKRDKLSPSFILSVVWTICLLLLNISNNIFFGISSNTYAIYFIGVCMFSAGESVADKFTYNRFHNNKIKSGNIEQKMTVNKKEKQIMFISLFILLISFPFYYKNIVDQSGASLLDINSFFWLIRRASLDNVGTGGFSLLANAVTFSLIISIYFYNGYKKDKQNRVMVFLIIVVSIVYQLLTGGRSGAVYMVLALMGIELLRERKIKIINFIILGGSLLFVIMFIAFFVSKGDVNNTKSVVDNLGAFYKDIVLYLLGGLVAFDSIVVYSGSIGSNGGVKRFFLETAHSLGFNVNVPSLHMQSTSIGPGIITNVYTIFSYYYIDYGLIGVCFFTFILGVISLWVYKKSKHSDLFSSIYGFFIAGIVLSVYGEKFFTNLNFFIKAIIVITMLEFIKKIRFYKHYTKEV